MTPEVLELKFLSKNFKKKIVGVSQSLRLLHRQGDDASIPLSVLPSAHRWELWTCAASQPMYSMKEAVFITCTCIDRKNCT